MGDVQDKRYGPMVYGRLRDQWRKTKSSWGAKSKVSMTKFSVLILFGWIHSVIYWDDLLVGHVY